MINKDLTIVVGGMTLGI